MDALLLTGAFGLAVTMVLIIMAASADVNFYGSRAAAALVMALWCGLGSLALVVLALT